jgi:hypothetical protein
MTLGQNAASSPAVRRRRAERVVLNQLFAGSQYRGSVSAPEVRADRVLARESAPPATRLETDIREA